MLRTLAALAGVCLLAWVGLRALSRRGFGSAGNAPVRVIARVGLDAHSSLHVVRAGSRVLLIGVGRGVAPSLITELDPDAFAEPATAEPARE
jgi:flagellar biogenesis protein FliO